MQIKDYFKIKKKAVVDINVGSINDEFRDVKPIRVSVAGMGNHANIDLEFLGQYYHSNAGSDKGKQEKLNELHKREVTVNITLYKKQLKELLKMIEEEMELMI